MEIKQITPKVCTYSLETDRNDPEYYTCLWARFSFDRDNGSLSIMSDAGDFSYQWGYNDHEDFMHLMSRINKDYLLNKIASRSVFLLEQSKKDLIKHIEDIGWEDYGINSEEEWDEIKNEILELSCESETEFCQEIDRIVPDIEWIDIDTATDYPVSAKTIVDLFEKYVQPQIKSDFTFSKDGQVIDSGLKPMSTDSHNEELEAYKQIGSIEEVKELKERSIAKKPTPID